MRFTHGLPALAVSLLLLSVCDAAFNVTRAKQLTNITQTPDLLIGNDQNTRIFMKVVEGVRKRFRTCSPNVCFALDGSGPSEFVLQKSFVEVVIAALGGLTGSKFAAVEYASIQRAIATLAPASPEMLINVRNALRTGGFAFIGPAIQWCSSIIQLQPAHVNKIIFLWDQPPTPGGSCPRFEEVNLAKAFRNQGPGYKTCAVVVGNSSCPWSDIVSDPDLVFREPSWAQHMMTVALALVEKICSP